jgi:hypothetical protein
VCASSGIYVVYKVIMNSSERETTSFVEFLSRLSEFSVPCVVYETSQCKRPSLVTLGNQQAVAYFYEFYQYVTIDKEVVDRIYFRIL